MNWYDGQKWIHVDISLLLNNEFFVRHCGGCDMFLLLHKQHSYNHFFLMKIMTMMTVILILWTIIIADKKLADWLVIIFNFATKLHPVSKLKHFFPFFIAQLHPNFFFLVGFVRKSFWEGDNTSWIFVAQFYYKRRCVWSSRKPFSLKECNVRISAKLNGMKLMILSCLWWVQLFAGLLLATKFFV